jgi:drug/metabolite transporter (DMT)-like permease
VLFITEQHVPIGLTSLIIASVPLWVLLLRLRCGERPDRVATIGLVVGFGGIVLLVTRGRTPARSATCC